MRRPSATTSQAAHDSPDLTATGYVKRGHGPPRVALAQQIDLRVDGAAGEHRSRE